MTLEEAVWVDPGRMSGAPCFRGTRLPVQQLFDWLADGVSLDEFINDFRIDQAAAEVVLRTAGIRLCRESTGMERTTENCDLHIRPVSRGHVIRAKVYTNT